jgi:hypothetical protein
METRDSPTSVGIVSVAIGARYIRYWENLLISADTNFDSFSNVRAHVFTDRPLLVAQLAKRLRKIAVVAHPVPTVGWPEATMLRYQFFLERAEDLSEDVLIYLDADMEIRSAIPASIVSKCHRDGALLVQHPGFYRSPEVRNRASFYVAHPGFLVRDAITMVRFGGLGDWETRKTSTAFVPRGERRTYVCGGTWMARRDVFVSICRELSNSTALDESRNVVAKWHDESHLNRFQAERNYTVLSPSWCFVEHAKNLNGLRPLVVAIEKGSNRTR